VSCSEAEDRLEHRVEVETFEEKAEAWSVGAPSNASDDVDNWPPTWSLGQPSGAALR
jgi:hypothetical protein